MEILRNIIKRLDEVELLEWNPTIGFMTWEEIEKLANETAKGDPYYLPMHGMSIMWIDDEIKRIVTEFNPKYIVNAGEDSFFEIFDYPETEMIYKYKDHHAVPAHCGIPTEIEKFKLKDHYGLFIGQCDIGSKLSFVLLKECDEDFARLSSILTTYRRGEGKKYADEIKLIEYLYKNCFGIEFNE